MGWVTTSRPRGWRPAIAAALVMTGMALLLVPGAIVEPRAFPLNEHAKATLDLALNLTFCGRAGVQSSQFLPARYLTANPQDLQLSPRELIARSGLTLEQYCGTLTERVTNNENTLMLMQAATWRLAPDASVAAIGRVAAWTRVVFVAVFAVACLVAGVSMALVFLSTWAALAILAELAWLEFNEYPFLIVLPLIWAAVCTFAYGTLVKGINLRSAGVALALGVLGGFAGNLRSSFLPILVLHWVIVVLLSSRVLVRTRGMAATVPRSATALAAFVIGMLLFQQAVIRPVVTPEGDDTTNYTYHAVAHTLVLGLAVPENALSQAEGIRWDDMSGRALALRVQPGVAYLGPDYERVMFNYYIDLWRRAPRQMLATYWLKVKNVGAGIFLDAAALVRDAPVIGRVYRVWVYRVNGAGLILGCASLTALAAVVAWRRPGQLALLATLLTSAALLVLVESAIMYSEFLRMYHSYLLFGITMAPAVALQVVADAVVPRLVRPLPASPRAV